MRKTLLCAIVGGLALAGPVSAQKYNLTVAGYSPGGLVSTMGAGIDAALNAAYPGSTVTYQTSSGGLANAGLLQRGKVPLAFISDTELNVVVKGKKPFKKPMTNLRLLMSPYVAASRFQATQTMANKDWADKHGIKTFADIARKKPPMRIVVNRPGNLDGDVSITTLKMIGVSLDDIKKWGGQVVRGASREMTSLILDRRVDVASLGISYRHPRIREMANGLPVVLLPMSDEVAKKTADEMGAELCHIKASEYKFLAADTASVCVGMTLVVRSDMSEQLAYNVTKGVFQNIEKFKAAHRLLKKVVTPQRLAQPQQVAFHPGAAKYLREAGLLK